MRLILIVAAFVMTTAITHAADHNGRFAPKGAGLASCGRFVEEYKPGSDPYVLLRGWLDGYLTATNQLMPETFDITAWESTTFIGALVENHCAKHADDQFLEVLMTIVTGLKEHRVREESPEVAIRVAGQETIIYESTLREVQSG